jgi:tetratricopeptide (TPR) repeat protein
MLLPQALIVVEQLHDAQALIDRLLADADRQGNVLATAFARQWRTVALLRQGALRQSAREAERALAVRADGWEAATDQAAATLAEARLELGDPDSARAAIAYGRQASARAAQPVLLQVRGRLALAEGNAADALRDFQAAGSYLESAFSITNPLVLAWRSQAALALHHLGDAAGARRVAATEVATARRLGLNRSLGIALRTAEAIAEPAESIAMLREAVALLERTPARLEHAHALCEFGAALRRQRQHAAAQEPLSQALELAHAADAARSASCTRRAGAPAAQPDRDPKH